MALNRLTSAEMMSLSATMVDAGHGDHQALLGQPALAGLMPGMMDAHNMLLDASLGRLQMLLAPLSQAQKEVDHSHDWLARAVRSGIELYIALARAQGDHELAGKLERLMSAMFPNGLQIVNASYREEAGHAQVLRTLLTADVEAVLGNLSAQGGTLLDLVRAWIAAGDRLGELENQRVALLTAGRGSDMHRARSRWSKMIAVLRVVIDTLEVSDPVVHQLMDRIVRAERVADKRSLNGSDEPDETGDEPSDQGEPAADDGEPSEPGDEPGHEFNDEPGDVPGDVPGDMFDDEPEHEFHDEPGDGWPKDLLTDTLVGAAHDAPADMRVEVAALSP